MPWDILILIHVVVFLPVFPLFFSLFKQILGSILIALGEACVRTENRKIMRGS